MFPFIGRTRSARRNEIKAGDIIGFSGDSWISAGINIATYGIPFWGISHVGIMGNAADGRLLIFESTSLDDLPCEISRRELHWHAGPPVGRHSRRVQGKGVALPALSAAVPERGRAADRVPDGDAFTSPTTRWGRSARPASACPGSSRCCIPSNLHTIFCSEWVAAAYAVTGLHATDNVSRWNPNRLCRNLRWHEILCKPRRLK